MWFLTCPRKFQFLDICHNDNFANPVVWFNGLKEISNRIFVIIMCTGYTFFFRKVLLFLFLNIWPANIWHVLVDFIVLSIMVVHFHFFLPKYLAYSDLLWALLGCIVLSIMALQSGGNKAILPNQCRIIIGRNNSKNLSTTIWSFEVTFQPRCQQQSRRPWKSGRRRAERSRPKQKRSNLSVTCFSNPNTL